jgi:hypothetical protein
MMAYCSGCVGHAVTGVVGRRSSIFWARRNRQDRAGFEAALTALNLTKRQDPATLLVARTVFEAAKHGELDPDRLRDIAVRAFSK